MTLLYFLHFLYFVIISPTAATATSTSTSLRGSRVRHRAFSKRLFGKATRSVPRNPLRMPVACPSRDCVTTAHHLTPLYHLGWTLPQGLRGADAAIPHSHPSLSARLPTVGTYTLDGCTNKIIYSLFSWFFLFPFISIYPIKLDLSITRAGENRHLPAYNDPQSSSTSGLLNVFPLSC